MLCSFCYFLKPEPCHISFHTPEKMTGSSKAKQLSGFNAFLILKKEIFQNRRLGNEAHRKVGMQKNDDTQVINFHKPYSLDDKRSNCLVGTTY